MPVCVYPGTFDPITCGHLDIIKRAAPMFERMIVLVGHNSSKHPLFSVEERTAHVKACVKGFPNVEVDSFDGLLVEYAQRAGAQVILRGLRALTDFEYEYQIASTNHALRPGIESIFLMTSVQYAFLSSSIVREVGRFGESLAGMVPEQILEEVSRKLMAPASGISREMRETSDDTYPYDEQERRNRQRDSGVTPNG